MEKIYLKGSEKLRGNLKGSENFVIDCSRFLQAYTRTLLFLGLSADLCRSLQILAVLFHVFLDLCRPIPGLCWSLQACYRSLQVSSGRIHPYRPAPGLCRPTPHVCVGLLKVSSGLPQVTGVLCMPTPGLCRSIQASAVLLYVSAKCLYA